MADAMTEVAVEEILLNDDSDDEFFGFSDEYKDAEDITVLAEDDIELTDEQLDEIQAELDAESRNPTLDAYDCQWLKRFAEVVGPASTIDATTAYNIFAHFIDQEVLTLLVDETN